MQATDFMIDSNDLYKIKFTLIEQSVKRLLDAHLGTYIFEEGEIVELWEPDDALENTARRIAKYNIDMYDYESESDESEYDESESDDSESDDSK
jgi:hypothetical protein